MVESAKSLGSFGNHREPISGPAGYWSGKSDFSGAVAVFSVFCTAWLISVRGTSIKELININADDAFYYYVVARNFAAGQFSTFDGMNLTNGYHPLWAWILTPVFAFVGDPDMALHVAKMLEAALLLSGALLVMGAGRAAGWHPLTACLASLLLLSMPVLFVGMESAPLAFLLALLLFLITQLFAATHQTAAWLATGLVCAVLPWARLESLSTTLVVATGVTANALLRRRFALRPIAFLWACMLGGPLLYFLYNALAFGTATPVSGQVKNYWSSLRFAEEGYPGLLRNAVTILRWYRELTLATLLASAIILLSWLQPRYRTVRHAAEQAIDLFLLSLGAAYLARVGYSALFLYPAYNEAWYFAPGYILLALTPSLLIDRLFLALDILRPGFGDRRPWLQAGVATLGLVALVVLANPWPSRANPEAEQNWDAASFQGVQWINRNLPAGSVIGSPDAGVIGYFSTHRVINIDGLVNSTEFLTAIKTQSIEAWMRKAGITHLAGGVPAGREGCEGMARASFQHRPYTGPCTLLFDGMPFEIDGVPYRFRVFAFGEAARQPQ